MYLPILITIITSLIAISITTYYLFGFVNMIIHIFIISFFLTWLVKNSFMRNLYDSNPTLRKKNQND